MDEETEVLKVEVACLGSRSYNDRPDPACSPHGGTPGIGLQGEDVQAAEADSRWGKETAILPIRVPRVRGKARKSH